MICGYVEIRTEYEISIYPLKGFSDKSVQNKIQKGETEIDFPRQTDEGWRVLRDKKTRRVIAEVERKSPTAKESNISGIYDTEIVRVG